MLERNIVGYSPSYILSVEKTVLPTLAGCKTQFAEWVGAKRESNHLCMINGVLTIVDVKPWRDYGVTQFAAFIGDKIVYGDGVLYAGGWFDITFFLSKIL